MKSRIRFVKLEMATISANVHLLGIRKDRLETYAFITNFTVSYLIFVSSGRVSADWI